MTVGNGGRRQVERWVMAALVGASWLSWAPGVAAQTDDQDVTTEPDAPPADPLPPAAREQLRALDEAPPLPPPSQERAKPPTRPFDPLVAVGLSMLPMAIAAITLGALGLDDERRRAPVGYLAGGAALGAVSVASIAAGGWLSHAYGRRSPPTLVVGVWLTGIGLGFAGMGIGYFVAGEDSGTLPYGSTGPVRAGVITLTVVGVAATAVGLPLAALSNFDDAVPPPASAAKLYTGLVLSTVGLAAGVVAVHTCGDGLLFPCMPATLVGVGATSVGISLWASGDSPRAPTLALGAGRVELRAEW